MSIFLLIFSLFITATTTLTFALRSWQRGAARTRWFSLLLGSLAVGTFSYSMELWGIDEMGKSIWFSIKLGCFIFSAVFWLLFTLQFTERQAWLRRRYLVPLGIIPALTLIMLITRRYDWMFRNMRIVQNPFLAVDYGPYFWVHTAYMYFLFGLGFVFLLQWLKKNRTLQAPRLAGLLVGIGLPFVTNLMAILQNQSAFPFDLTPLGMALGFLVIGWILFGLNFSGVNPIAREALIESLKDGVIVIDTRRIITDINPAALRLVSTTSPLLGQRIETAISEPIILPTLESDDTYPHQEITFPSLRGLPQILDVRASPLTDKTRILRGWLLLLRDITEQKRLQNELKKQSLRNAALAEIELAINQPHELAGVLRKIVDTTYELLPAPGGVTIYMWNEDTRTFEHADSTLPPGEISQLLARAKQGRGSASWIVNYKQPKIVPDTRHEPFDDYEVLASKKIMAYAGFPLISNNKVVGVFYANDTQPRVYTEDDIHFLQTLSNRAANAILRVQQFSQVQHQAVTDHLTGIFNRRQLFNLGELEFRRARRFSRPLSTIMMDIDHFKNINDTYGHTKGDQVLKALAQFLKIHLREFDILGRYGGEEFVIVLPGADLLNARNVAYRLRKGVQDRPMINGSVSITLSLGVAELSNDILDFQALMHKADMAMYDAKRAGRNRVAWLE